MRKAKRQVLQGISQRDFQGLLLSVGKTTRARRPLSPIEVGELCAKCLEAGATIAEITDELKMTDKGMVAKFLRTKEIVPSLRHLVSWGHSADGALGFSVAAQVARLPADQQELAAEAVLKHKLTRDEMTSVIQLLSRSEDPLDKCIDRVVRRRPVVRVRQIVLGAITDGRLATKLGKLTQLKRDDLLLRVVTELFPTAKDFTAKLGIERFTIIGGKTVASTVAADPQVEQHINESLAAGLK
jgi:hypothetical protein